MQPRWIGDVNLGASMGMKWDMDGGETPISTLIEVLWDLDGGEQWFGCWAGNMVNLYMDVGVTRIFGHWVRWGRAWMELISRLGCVSDGSWVEMRSNFRDLDGGKTSPRCSWDANIETWIEVRHCLDRCEMLMWVAWMEFRHKLDGCEMGIYGPGWKWDGKWMGVRWYSTDLDQGGTGTGCRWDADFETWLGLIQCLYRAEMRPGWRRDAIVWTCMKVKQYMDVGEITIFGSRFNGTRASWMHILIHGWLSVRPSIDTNMLL